jgi:putative AlgH/UPF0301 family transcriptional regulator
MQRHLSKIPKKLYIVEMNAKLSNGKLLVADPSIIGDFSFTRAVVLLADHNDEGSVGFILNKPMSHDLRPFRYLKEVLSIKTASIMFTVGGTVFPIQSPFPMSWLGVVTLTSSRL